MSSREYLFRIAIATDDGEHVNGHFGSCERFAIYQLDAQSYQWLEDRTPSTTSGVDKNDHRAAQIGDCQILYVASIGGPAAAKVIKQGLYPLKDAQMSTIDTALTRLQEVVSTRPPPWMAKLMGEEAPLAQRIGTDSIH